MRTGALSLLAAAAAALALGGCGASSVSAPVATADVVPTAGMDWAELPCKPMTTVDDCRETLTNVYLLASGAFDDPESPTEAQVRADITLDEASARWAVGCRLESKLVAYELDAECVQIIRDLAEAAILIDPTIDD